MIYLDNAATTAMLPEVEKAIADAPFGNPSSLHAEGIRARQALEDARKTIAGSVGCNPCELFFTSGGTEANNWVIKGMGKGHIITTKIEHDCVLAACRWHEKQGDAVTYLDVDEEGFVDPEALEQAIRPDTVLVSIIHGNNEIGTLQDLAALGKVCKRHDIPLHIDACQSFGKVPIELTDIDMMTINAHKMNGPKGVGGLYIRKGLRITPLLHGGGHEMGRRSGTENVPGIMGFAAAIEHGFDYTRLIALRDKLIEGLLSIEGTRLNGPKTDRLPNNVNVSFARVEGESIIELLNLQGIAASTGSACSSKSLEPSHVMMALEPDPERAHGSVRLSLGRETTEREIDAVLETMPGIIDQLRKISALR